VTRGPEAFAKATPEELPAHHARDRAKAAHDLEWADLLDRIAGSTVSVSGAAFVRALEPAATPVEARDIAERSREALDLEATGFPIPVVALPDLDEPLERIARGGVASGQELRGVRRLLEASRTLRNFVASRKDTHPALAAALATEPKLDRLLEELTHAIDDDGDVTDRASPELAKARRRASDARRELTARLGELLNRYGDVLSNRFYTERDGRYVLPVRADAPFRVEGIVLGSSSSGGTLYVEPLEVTALGNKRKMAEAEVEREVLRVLTILSSTARDHVDALRFATDATTLADVLSALARFGHEVGGAVLPVDTARVLDLRTMRHPLLEGRIPGVIANDVRVSGGHGLVISGPNAGGKTVALKCLGLAAWMVRTGIPIPADRTSRIGFFEPVLTDIGDEQSLARSLSTFAAHSTRLASYIERSEDGALVLLDEVAAGTDPDEGAALAAAVLETFVERGAAAAVTTHYEHLKELPIRDARFENASVGFDFERMLPTFRLTLGIPGASSALAVALRYGVPKDVILRAEALLPEENLKRDALLAEIETDRARAREERAAAEADADEQARLRDELEKEVTRAREQERARLARESNELTAAVRDARARLRTASERLGKSDVGRDELRRLEKDVNAAAGEVALGSRVDGALHAGPPSAVPKLTSPISPGDTVYLSKLRTHAEVLEAPSRGMVKVAAGPLKINVRLDEIEPARAGAKAPQASVKKPRIQAAPVRTDATPVRSPSITCDVRGMRADETRDKVDGFVDRMLTEGEPAAFVLHGHGTGALKNVVREHLTGHRSVERARPADADQGGDAFTVFWLGG
jgi:DNA mismatch repair protein MutS2